MRIYDNNLETCKEVNQFRNKEIIQQENYQSRIY